MKLWNLSHPDTIGPDSSVLNTESLIQGLLSTHLWHLGQGESVLFIEVSSFQGSSLEGFHCLSLSSIIVLFTS